MFGVNVRVFEPMYCSTFVKTCEPFSFNPWLNCTSSPQL